MDVGQRECEVLVASAGLVAEPRVKRRIPRRLCSCAYIGARQPELRAQALKSIYRAATLEGAEQHLVEFAAKWELYGPRRRAEAGVLTNERIAYEELSSSEDLWWSQSL